MTNDHIPTIELRDGTKIPQIGYGTFLMTGDTCRDMTEQALAAGYRHIDTAMVYHNEREVGQAITASGISRDELYITTKLGNTEQVDPLGGFERSLDRLGLDTVNLYLLHWPLPKRDTAIPAWEAMAQIAESGRATSIGVCNFEIEHLERLIETTGVTPQINQIELHPEHQRAELVTYCQERGIAIEAWGPLAQAKSDLLTKAPIVQAAELHGKTPAQVALKWHLNRGNIILPKTATPSRLVENIDLFDFTLSDAELRAIDALETGTNYGPNPFTYDG